MIVGLKGVVNKVLYPRFRCLSTLWAWGPLPIAGHVGDLTYGITLRRARRRMAVNSQSGVLLLHVLKHIQSSGGRQSIHV